MPASANSCEPKRILIYGVTGSGKSTFAARLSEATGIRWHPVDDLAFVANWESTTEEFQREKIEAICAGEEWILDTAYGKWIEVPLARVDLIVGLDYPRWFSLGRLIRRTMSRIRTKKPVCNGNIETVGKMLSRDSIILWHFKSFRRKRDRMRQWAALAGGPATLLFKSPKDAEAWLATLAESSGISDDQQ